jgi:hypothetical protein
MKVRHLAGRFTRALYPGAPRPEDLAWVATILTSEADALFRRQPRHDQRHAIGVARDVEARLAGTADADDPRWLVAALLHDIGKLDARLGITGRVVATVSATVAGRDMADAWSQSGGFTRRVGLYLRHAELGADRIRLAGGPEEAARWAAVHHDPTQWSDLGIPEPVVAALDAADND